MSLADAIGGVLLLTLAVYTVTGGADFGGGVWDLLATGPRKERQRAAIADAIGPIWEANHVWLILMVVILFVTLPKAFAALSIALHIPLTLMLVGVVMRGSAFVFRSYDPHSGPGVVRWRRVFAISSALTPIFLGVVLGAVIAGTVRVDPITGAVPPVFVDTWLHPFPFVVGAFVLALFAFLAAVYLAAEVDDADLAEDFRRRALVSAVVVGALALVAAVTAHPYAPRIAEGLLTRWWSLPLQILTGVVAVGAIAALWRRRYRVARVLAILQAGLIVAGLGLSSYPYIIAPDLTLADAAAPDSVITAFLAVLACGGPVLVWAMWLLFKIFKTGNGRRDGERDKRAP